MPRGIPNKKPEAPTAVDAILRVKRLHPLAQIPKFQTAGAACFDLHSVSDTVAIPAGQARTVNIGLAFGIPDGHVLMVYSRSGLGFNHGLRLANGTGVVDSDFTGGIVVRLHNDSAELYAVHTGDRVAQAMLVKLPKVVLQEVDTLAQTARGANGFGSSGK